MFEGVYVEAYSRLHFGFYGIRSEVSSFGSIGLAIKEPKYRILAIKTKKNKGYIEGCQSTRAEKILKKATEFFSTNENNYIIKIYECIPPHRGLGSTTQLTLSIYTALAILEGYSYKNLLELAEAARRGLFSGIGIMSFLYGGFSIDSGRRGSHPPKPLVNIMFPKTWKIIVLVPKARNYVEEGSHEINLMERAFTSIYLNNKAEELSLKAAYVVLRKLLPALLYRSFEDYTLAIEEIDNINATLFTTVQGRRYCCPEAEKTVNVLRKLGFRGVGQSSWGPAVYGFTKVMSIDTRVITSELKSLGVDTEYIYITNAANHGARIVPIHRRNVDSLINSL